MTPKEQMIKILKDNGIEMMVEGCGCCGSPCVSFNYKGKQILDGQDDCTFNTETKAGEEE